MKINAEANIFLQDLGYFRVVPEKRVLWVFQRAQIQFRMQNLMMAAVAE